MSAARSLLPRVRVAEVRRRGRALGAVLVGVVLGLSACGEARVATAEGRQEIVGGEETDGFLAVVEIEYEGRYASGVVIGERVVLTVGHAVSRVVGTPAVAEGKVYFGARTTGEGAEPERIVGTVDARMHRYFWVDSEYFFDIGLVLLAEDAGVEPVAVDGRDLGVVLGPGDRVTMVGFGYVNGAKVGAGVKRLVEVPVRAVSDHYIEYEQAGLGTCSGDSGGPHLIEVDGVVRVVGVTAWTNCRGWTLATRLDRYLEEFVYPTVDRWEGPCRLDGVCVTEGCRTPDPDCDGCGYDDVCEVGCPVRDLDCPLAGLVGAACEAHGDCESGLCVSAVDDERIRYCSYPCLPQLDDEVCGFWMRCEELEEPPPGDRYGCRYRVPTPGAQGAYCVMDEQCRSGRCLVEDRICVEPCMGPGSCPAGFECVGSEDDRVCRFPVEETGCGCASGRGASGGWAGVAVVVLLAWRRRGGPRRMTASARPWLQAIADLRSR